MRKIRVLPRDDQKTALDALSTRTGTPRSELVRRSVDLLLGSTAEQNESWREATRDAFGIWRDRSDIATVSSRLRERR